MFFESKMLISQFVIGVLVFQAFYKFYILFHWDQYFVLKE